jgi:hypothetical protein
MANDLALVEEELEEELLPEPMSKTEAKKLDRKIRAATDKWQTQRDLVLDLLDEAAAGQIWVNLDYKSWTAWFADAVQISVADRSKRKELAIAMSGRGMTQSAIAKSLGWSQKTIDRDLEGAEFDTDTVTAQDGKTIPRNKPVTVNEDGEQEDEYYEEPEPPARRAPIMSDWDEEIAQLDTFTQAFHDLKEDDRYLKSRKRIAAKHVNTLQDIIAALNAVVDDLMEE